MVSVDLPTIRGVLDEHMGGATSQAPARGHSAHGAPRPEQVTASLSGRLDAPRWRRVPREFQDADGRSGTWAISSGRSTRGLLEQRLVLPGRAHHRPPVRQPRDVREPRADAPRSLNNTLYAGVEQFIASGVLPAVAVGDRAGEPADRDGMLESLVFLRHISNERRSAAWPTSSQAGSGRTSPRTTRFVESRSTAHGFKSNTRRSRPACRRGS